MTAADHANTVREALDELAMWQHERCVKDKEHQSVEDELAPIVAALDALQTQAETAEEWERRCKLEYRVRMDTKAMMEAAEAEAKRLQKIERNNTVLFDKMKAAEAERDRLREAYDGALDRLIAAKAERDHARDALRQIEVVTRRAIKEGFLHQADWKEVGHIARAALGEDA